MFLLWHKYPSKWWVGAGQVSGTCMQVVHISKGCKGALPCNTDTFIWPHQEVLWDDVMLNPQENLWEGMQGISDEIRGLADSCSFSLLFKALVYKMQIYTFKNCTNKTSFCVVLFIYCCFVLFVLFWLFSLNFSTSISGQWLLISSCRSHLWRRLGSLWSVSGNICT